jgi:hypothetical protein
MLAGTGQAVIGIKGEVGGHHEVTTRLVQARRSSTCFTVESTCSAVTRAHGTTVPEVMRPRNAAPGRGVRRAEARGVRCASGS